MKKTGFNRGLAVRWCQDFC